MAGRRGDAKGKLLDAGLGVIRAQGYAATSVDDLCQAAGVTKGAFFHHFSTKEDLAVAAARHFSQRADELFAAAAYRGLDDPMERLLGYIDFRKAIFAGDLPDYTCLLGTLVQETYASHPAIRAACERGILDHAATLEADIATLRARLPEEAREGWSAKGLALHTQVVLQGAFILAKATGGSELALESLDHLRRYLILILTPGDV